VVLSDATTGASICTATVVARVSPGDASDDGGVLGSFVAVTGGTKGCEYYAQFSTSASYSINISAPGYARYSVAGVQPITIPCNQVASPATIEIGIHPMQ
jgi:hypothetical protein